MNETIEQTAEQLVFEILGAFPTYDLPEDSKRVLKQRFEQAFRQHVDPLLKMIEARDGIIARESNAWHIDLDRLICELIHRTAQLTGKESKLEASEKACAEMRGAIDAVLNPEQKDSTVIPCHVEDKLMLAIENTSGRDYIHRSELDAAKLAECEMQTAAGVFQKRVKELEEVLSKSCNPLQHGIKTLCPACQALNRKRSVNLD